MNDTYRTFKNAIGRTDAEMLVSALEALPPNTQDPSEDQRRDALLAMFNEIVDSPDDAHENIVYWTLVPATDSPRYSSVVG